MSKPTRIAVVTSAPSSSEYEVSLRSAENVNIALTARFESVATFTYDEQLATALGEWKPDVVVPVAHGHGEDGSLQALLDGMGIAYVGCGSPSSALCWEKAAANACVNRFLTSAAGSELHSRGLDVPAYIAVRRGEDIAASVAAFCEATHTAAVVVKPAREGSSVGVTFCTAPHCTVYSYEEVVASINGPVASQRLDRIVSSVENAFQHDELVLVQAAVAGTEITVSILHVAEPVALPVIEITTPKGTWYNYEAKYSVGGSQHIIPARLPNDVLALAQQAAVELHTALGCRDLSRLDFIVSNEAGPSSTPMLWYLETNTLPGFTSTSLYPDSAFAAGIPLIDLAERLVMTAWRRVRKD